MLRDLHRRAVQADLSLSAHDVTAYSIEHMVMLCGCAIAKSGHFKPSTMGGRFCFHSLHIVAQLDRGHGCCPKVCLAAESCGHLGFDARVDKWWSSEIFHCGAGPRRDVHFHDIFLKVGRPRP